MPVAGQQTNPDSNPTGSPFGKTVAALIDGAVIRYNPTARNRAVALVAFDDWQRHEEAAGRPVPSSTWLVFSDVVRRAYEKSRVRVARGEVSGWYSELTTRVARTARNAAMRRLRAAGLIDGHPNAPDPANNFYRDRARYRVCIPAVCRQLLNRVKHAADRALTDNTAGRYEGRTTDHPRGFVIDLESQSPTTTRVDQDDGPDGGVDNGPPSPPTPFYFARKAAAGWA